MVTMFIDKEDYIQVSAEALRIMQQSTDANRLKAEERAISLASGYLRSQYDTDLIFAMEGEERDTTLVGYCIDIALYYLVSSLPQRMGYEVRKELYEQAVAWLKDVQKGNIILDLPKFTNEEGEVTAPIRYGSNRPNSFSW